MPAAITTALIGAGASLLSTASTITADAIKNSRGNLKGAINVFNGTDYNLTVSQAEFRKGALFGGTEGEFSKSPAPIGPRQIGIFSYQQIKGATTDVVGAVVYQADVFDLLIGWHLYDQAGIHKYIFSAIYPKGGANKYFKNAWGANLDQTLNQMIWSGSGSSKSKFSSNGVTVGRALKVKGTMKRGVVSDELDVQGLPIIKHQTVRANGKNFEFCTQGVGGGSTMNVFVSDAQNLIERESPYRHRRS